MHSNRFNSRGGDDESLSMNFVVVSLGQHHKQELPSSQSNLGSIGSFAGYTSEWMTYAVVMVPAHHANPMGLFNIQEAQEVLVLSKGCYHKNMRGMSTTLSMTIHVMGIVSFSVEALFYRIQFHLGSYPHLNPYALQPCHMVNSLIYIFP